MCLIHSQLIFIYGVRQARLYSFTCGYSPSPTLLLEVCFPSLDGLVTLLKTSMTTHVRVNSWISILFHWPCILQPDWICLVHDLREKAVSQLCMMVLVDFSYMPSVMLRTFTIISPLLSSPSYCPRMLDFLKYFCSSGEDCVNFFSYILLIWYRLLFIYGANFQSLH